MIDLGSYAAPLVWSIRNADSKEEVACVTFADGAGRIVARLSQIDGIGRVTFSAMRRAAELTEVGEMRAMLVATSQFGSLFDAFGRHSADFS